MERVFVRSVIAVLVKRNDRTQVFYQKSWNPDKNPGFETLKVKNQVEIRRDPRYKDVVEVAVSDKFGYLKPWEIRNGSLFFRSYGRITVDIIDHKAGEKQSLLACYEADRDGTLYAKLMAESVSKINQQERPLSIKLELPEELRAEKGKPDKREHRKDPGEKSKKKSGWEKREAKLRVQGMSAAEISAQFAN